MSLQSVLALSAAAVAALYFIWGILQDFRQSAAPAGSSCGRCSSGGCPVGRKG